MDSALPKEVVTILADIDLTSAEVAYLDRLNLEDKVYVAQMKARLGGLIGKELKARNIKLNPVEEDEPAETVPEASQRRRTTKRVLLSALQPNAINATVWSDSLGDESIKRLAEDIERHGLRQPIEVNEEYKILDGERRWRACRLSDASGEVDVAVVPGVLTDEDITAYIHDAAATQRTKSLTEKLALFELSFTVLKRRHGRPHGRPSDKDPRAEDLFWDAARIREEAARRADLGSAETARRLGKVLGGDDDDLKAAVEAGEMSISAAYQTMRPSKPATTDTEPSHEETSSAPAIASAASAADCPDGGEEEPTSDPAEERPSPDDGDPEPTEVVVHPASSNELVGDDVNDDEFVWEALGDVHKALAAHLAVALRTDRLKAMKWANRVQETCTRLLKAARKPS